MQVVNYMIKEEILVIQTVAIKKTFYQIRIKLIFK